MTIEQLTLEQDEIILAQVRKHWFVLATQIFALVIAAIFPLVVYVLFSGFVAQIFDLTPYTGYILFGYSAWLLIIWMSLFNVWTNYYLDIWTITNKRLMAIDQRGLFSRTTASFRLERLQDIIVSVNGIIPTLLNYGSLEIQTAGEERNFKEYGFPSPGNLKAMILSATDNLMSSAPRTQSPEKLS